MGKKQLYVISAIIFFGLFLLPAVLNGIAKKARAVPAAGYRPKVIFVNDAQQLWKVWEDLNPHGRTLVVASRHLHFVPVPQDGLYSLSDGSVSNIKLSDVYVRNVSYKNFLWIAARRGLFRKIHYVLSPLDLEQKAAGAGIMHRGDTFTVNDSGFPRTFSLHPPVEAPEPAIVHVDVSWLEQHSPEQVVELLGRFPVKPQVVTVSAAADDPDKRAEAGERLQKLKELLDNDRL